MLPLLLSPLSLPNLLERESYTLRPPPDKSLPSQSLGNGVASRGWSNPYIHHTGGQEARGMLYLRLILRCPLFNLVNRVYYTQAARGLLKSSPDLQRRLEGRIL